MGTVYEADIHTTETGLPTADFYMLLLIVLIIAFLIVIGFMFTAYCLLVVSIRLRDSLKRYMRRRQTKGQEHMMNKKGGVYKTTTRGAYNVATLIGLYVTGQKKSTRVSLSHKNGHPLTSAHMTAQEKYNIAVLEDIMNVEETDDEGGSSSEGEDAEAGMDFKVDAACDEDCEQEDDDDGEDDGGDDDAEDEDAVCSEDDASISYDEAIYDELDRC